MKSKEILSIAANALNEKKAICLSALKVDDLTVLTEYFLLCTATSSTHVKALADEAEFKLAEAGITPHHIEGKSTGWILLDYGSVIIHVMSKEARDFYNLDKMWSDGEPVDLNTLLISEQENQL